MSLSVVAKNGEENRIIATYEKAIDLPTVVIIGGIHGNEKAGIIALERVVQEIEKESFKLKGNFYALRGNLSALAENVRYKSADLNRLWTHETITKILSNGQKEGIEENTELAALYKLLKNILYKNKGPFYFIDLHTTSASTIPFITISDSLNNRKFASRFKIPVILGIEEFLEGPLLTYINEFGHIALGFEAGQHNDPVAIAHCEAFIWLSLVASKSLKAKEVPKYRHYSQLLTNIREESTFYEIDYRYKIQKDEHFMMQQGYENFDAILKEEPVAVSNSRPVKAPIQGKIFMPLYQKQGDDGFFIITKISKFWLQQSIFVRKLKLHHLLRLLPGIQQDKENEHILIVDPKTVKFMATEIFHLFGYRKQVVKDDKLHFIKRDRKLTNF